MLEVILGPLRAGERLAQGGETEGGEEAGPRRATTATEQGAQFSTLLFSIF